MNTLLSDRLEAMVRDFGVYLGAHLPLQSSSFLALSERLALCFQ
jgi:hypothetical protein